MLRESYIITNPHDDYAAYIIQLLYSKHGLKPICVYTDRKMSFYMRQQFPILDSDIIEAEFTAEPAEFPEVVAALEGRYKILGAIPALESEVELCATFLELLGIHHGSSPETLRRFRHKHAMKDYVRAHAPHLRVPLSLPVLRTEDVFSSNPIAQQLRQRKFVLKPTSGFALKGVAFFDRDATPEAISAHLDSLPGTEWVMEEFIGGDEWVVNGQVGSKGNVVIHSVLKEVRTSANGCDHLYGTTLKIDHADPVFEQLTAYASELVLALGLSCSPFHMELKLDDRGPCVVDLGARLIGNGMAFSLSKLHPDRPDMLDVAAHGYLFGGDYGLDAPVDWATYDARHFARVAGIAAKDEVIASLQGVDQVEHLAEFVRWGKKPFLGQKVKRTVDLFTLPFEVDLLGKGSRARFLDTVKRVPSMISWNPEGMDLATRAQGTLRNLAQRALPKALWLLEQAKERFSPQVELPTMPRLVPPFESKGSFAT